MEAQGEPAKRAAQLFAWLYGRNRWMRSLDAADGDSQRFSAAFKAKVAASASLSGGVQLQDVHTARDGTRKLVFALLPEEGGASGSVETVLIPMPGRKGLRYTACLSTQVGCAMNCQFCYTGRMGLLGNLSSAQIVEQIVEARRFLAAEAAQRGEVPAPINNVVFMGMGEPLHNYDAVMAAVDVLAEGLQLSRNKIIVSTVGLADQMRRFLRAGKAKLALSLHATTDEVRDWIVPTNRRHPISELVAVLEEFFPIAQAKGDKFVVLEYVLLRGINDSEEDARRLLRMTQGIYCMVNLIVFNPHEGTSFQRSSDEAVRAFRNILTAGGRVCTVRASKGDDEMAACGQLGDPGQSPRPAPVLTPPERFAQQLVAAAEQRLRQQQQQQQVQEQQQS